LRVQKNLRTRKVENFQPQEIADLCSMEKLSMEGLNRISVSDYRNQGKLPLVVLLDNVRSGLNVGSIFRTADAFAVEKILLCGITVQPPHREILKTALGSTDSVAWEYYSDPSQAVQQLKTRGYIVLAIEQTSDKVWLHEFDPAPGAKYAMVLGNEVDGVEDSLLEQCDGVLEIPQFGTKHSLNVAVAAGIVLWEAQKKLLALLS
jgi:tRNA G18 (ribose-2'-O)-methylase SpoU